MKPHYRRLAIVSASCLAILGILAMLPNNLVLRNVSRSMDLGWYVMVPFAEPKTGAIVALPIPVQAQSLAAKACISGLLLKRVVYRNPNGNLYLTGDYFPGRSFDSKFYGAVPEKDILGVYHFVMQTEKEEQAKPPHTLRTGCKDASISGYSDLERKE